MNEIPISIFRSGEKMKRGEKIPTCICQIVLQRQCNGGHAWAIDAYPIVHSAPMAKVMPY